MAKWGITDTVTTTRILMEFIVEFYASYDDLIVQVSL